MASDDERRLGRSSGSTCSVRITGSDRVRAPCDSRGAGRGSGFILDTFDKARGRRVGTMASTSCCISSALFDVDRLDDIRGRRLRAPQRGVERADHRIGLPEPDGGARFMVA